MDKIDSQIRPMHKWTRLSLFAASLPLELGHLLKIQLGALGASAVSSPSGVWGGAPAEIECGAF